MARTPSGSGLAEWFVIVSRVDRELLWPPTAAELRSAGGQECPPHTSIAARRIQAVAPPSQTKLIVLNLKAGMPTVEQAKRRLLESLLPSKSYADVVLDATPDLATVERNLYDAIVKKRDRGGARQSSATGYPSTTGRRGKPRLYDTTPPCLFGCRLKRPAGRRGPASSSLLTERSRRLCSCRSERSVRSRAFRRMCSKSLASRFCSAIRIIFICGLGWRRFGRWAGCTGSWRGIEPSSRTRAGLKDLAAAGVGRAAANGLRST